MIAVLRAAGLFPAIGLAILLDCLATGNSSWGADAHRSADRQTAAVPRQTWLGDYAAAMRLAEKNGRMMLIHFRDAALSAQFDAVLSEPVVQERLKDYVRVELPLDAKILVQGEPVELLKHSAFAEMLGLPGLAVIDYAHKGEATYGALVSVFPFLDGRTYSVEEAVVILDLPPGKLTQRTMIFAVRTHPERPASVQGPLDANLLAEAESHSANQAQMGVQGHHGWDHRFQRINGRLPGGCLSYEVCAESWPGQGLLRSAIECVRCWRLSSGHWHSVASPCRAYGYDIKLGRNGIWYATGLFGR